MKTPKPKLILLCLSLILSIGAWGCAQHAIPPPPLEKSAQQNLGAIGVVVRSSAEQDQLDVPGSGRWSNIGRASGLGAAIGAGIPVGGSLANPLILLAIPATATLGLVGGAFYGAVASEPWQETYSDLRTVVMELKLHETLPEHLVAFSRGHGYEMTYLPEVGWPELRGESRDAAASRDGIDTVLEIKHLIVNLVPAEFMVNPARTLTLSMRMQLVRTIDGKILDDRIVTEDQGPALTTEDWTADHGARFRMEVREASQRLAEKAAMELLMMYRFPERKFSATPLLDISMRGLQPNQPWERARLDRRKVDEDIQEKYSEKGFSRVPAAFVVFAQRSDSLRPTLSWESFPGTGVTYDIKVWQSGRLGPETVVYDRTKLDQTSHELEVTLEPSTLYFWSVRAHFSTNGKDQITEWSRRSLTASLSAKILTWGLAALFPDPVPEGFFVFITPPSAAAESN